MEGGEGIEGQTVASGEVPVVEAPVAENIAQSPTIIEDNPPSPVIDEAPVSQESVAAPIIEKNTEISSVQEAAEDIVAQENNGAQNVIDTNNSLNLRQSAVTEQSEKAPAGEDSGIPNLEGQSIEKPENDETQKANSENTTINGVKEELGSDLVEHEDKAKVEARVRKIGERFDAPQSAIDQGLKSEILVIKNERFNQELIEEEKDSLTEKEREEYGKIMTDKYSNKEDLAKARENFFSKHEKDLTERSGEREKTATEDAEAMGGVTIPSENGESTILVKEEGPFDREHVKDHETLHAMSRDKDGKYDGFNTNIDILSGSYSHNNLNEAATEILALDMKYPELPLKEMANKVIKGEINAGYGINVYKMLSIMDGTSQNENPFTVKELAKYYLHNFEEDRDAVSLLRSEIGKRIRPDFFNKSIQLLDNDLEDPKPKAT